MPHLIISHAFRYSQRNKLLNRSRSSLKQIYSCPPNAHQDSQNATKALWTPFTTLITPTKHTIPQLQKPINLRHLPPPSRSLVSITPATTWHSTQHFYSRNYKLANRTTLRNSRSHYWYPALTLPVESAQLSSPQIVSAVDTEIPR